MATSHRLIQIDPFAEVVALRFENRVGVVASASFLLLPQRPHSSATPSMPDTDLNMAEDEVSTPAYSSTDESDSESSAENGPEAPTEAPSSRYDWLVSIVVATVNSVLDRILQRVDAVVTAALANFSSRMINTLDEIAERFADKIRERDQVLDVRFQEQERAFDAKFQELERAFNAKNQALEAEILQLKKEGDLVRENRQGTADIHLSARSIKRLRSQTDTEPSTIQPPDFRGRQESPHSGS